MNKNAISPICVVGDCILDKTVYCKCDRFSPEAPCPVLEPLEVKYSLGGAANVAKNLSSIKTPSYLLSAYGSDSSVHTIHSLLHRSNIRFDFITTIDRPTTVKERFVVGNYQVCRVDTEKTSPIKCKYKNLVNQFSKYCMNQGFGALILSNYCKGLLHEGNTHAFIEAAHDKGIPVFVDAKNGLFDKKGNCLFYGADVIKPNYREFRDIVGYSVSLGQGCKELLERCQACAIIVTMGPKGCHVYTHDQQQRIEGHEVVDVDVTGAGDTFIATLATFVSNGHGLIYSAEVANAAGSIVVQKQGASTCTLEEIYNVMEKYDEFYCGKGVS